MYVGLSMDTGQEDQEGAYKSSISLSSTVARKEVGQEEHGVGFDSGQAQIDSRKSDDEGIATGEEDEEACEWLDNGDKDEEERISLSLVGKLWSERTLNPYAFMATIKNVWVTKYGVEINMIGKNIFQFQFFHWKDKERVLGGQPWHFDRVALLQSEMEEAEKPSDLQFYSLPIWARVYNVPFRGRYNETNARIIGDKIGEFIELDKTKSLGMEKSLRIRVALDVRNPLKKHVSIKVRGVNRAFARSSTRNCL